MRIDSSGMVGIGLIPSVANLEVKTNLYVRHPNEEELTFRIDNYGTTGTDAGSLLRMYDQAGNTTVNIDSRSGSTRDTYFNNGGNVGIGTTSPDSKVHIEDAVNRSMNGSGEGQFQITGNGYTFGIALDATAAHLYHNSAGRSLILGTNEQPRLTIEPYGNVGIGTTSPGQLLSVNGNIVSNSFYLYDSTSNDRNVMFLDGSDNLLLATGTSTGARSMLFTLKTQNVCVLLLMAT